MLLLLDNYDSFTFNLAHACAKLGWVPEIYRNDALSISQIRDLHPEAIILSPGPGRPKDAGVSKKVIETFGTSIPILGVCLGHQAIGEVFGATISHSKKAIHGKVSPVFHRQKGLFDAIPMPFEAARYHSLSVFHCPSSLEITAWTEDGTIMGLQHRVYPIMGVQFHPESILTPWGQDIIKNFILAIPQYRIHGLS